MVLAWPCAFSLMKHAKKFEITYLWPVPTAAAGAGGYQSTASSAPRLHRTGWVTALLGNHIPLPVAPDRIWRIRNPPPHPSSKARELLMASAG